MSGVFQYAELESPSHTRVIELFPYGHKRHSPLRCQIHHVDLKHLTIKYTALSYAWGNPALRMKSIECQGTKIPITPNLYSAFFRLRHASETRTLWVDAVSIRQGQEPSALQEKNDQIRLMTEIFRLSNQTIVDLGVRGSEDVLMVENIRKYTAISNDQWNDILSKVNQNVYRDPWQEPETTGDIYEDYHLPKFDDKFWLALSNFMERPWFGRLWVIQEYAISPHVEILVGEELVPNIFTEGCRRALQHHLYMACRMKSRPTRMVVSHFLSRVPGVSPLLTTKDRDSAVLRSVAMSTRYSDTWTTMAWVAFTRRSLTDEDGEVNDEKAAAAGLNFCRMLQLTLQFKVTDVRDRVYAILGMLGDRHAPELYVDYQESIEQLSTRVSYFHMKRHLSAISMLHHCVGVSSLSGPSWSIELRRDTRDRMIHLLYEIPSKKIFDCGYAYISMPLNTTERPGIISCQGVFLGSIMSQTYAAPTLGPDVTVAEPDSLVLKGPAIWDWLYDTFVWISELQKEVVLKDIWSVRFEDFDCSCYRTLMADICDINSVDSETGRPAPTRIADSPRGECLLDSMRTFGELVNSGVSLFSLAMKLKRRKRQMEEWIRAIEVAGGRRLGVIQTGPCLLPAKAEVNDIVAVLWGFPFPFVLRSAEGGTFRIVGTCYAHGMMDGQALYMFPEVYDILLS